MDYPFNLKGILYFPQQSNKLQVMPGEIKLYNNQVYIADNIKEVVPEYLMLLKGVIDCPDLPLNVSRSFLQNDGDVQKSAATSPKRFLISSTPYSRRTVLPSRATGRISLPLLSSAASR